MKTILIAVDFSDASLNVIEYAASLSRHRPIERIILLKSFYVSVYAQLLPSADFVQLSANDIQQERDGTVNRLKQLGKSLIQKCNANIKVETAVSELPLLRAIHRIADDENPDLLLLGSDNQSYMDRSYIGQQLIAIVKSSPIPVLIVPVGVKHHPVEQAVIPCDFNAISRLQALKVMQPKSWFKPKLMVLNVDPDQRYRRNEQQNIEALNNFLQNYTHEIHYSADNDIVQATLNFAKKHHAQLIIALPGEHSFFYKLTHQSISQALAQNEDLPVLILK